MARIHIMNSGKRKDPDAVFKHVLKPTKDIIIKELHPLISKLIPSYKGAEENHFELMYRIGKYSVKYSPYFSNKMHSLPILDFIGSSTMNIMSIIYTYVAHLLHECKW